MRERDKGKAKFPAQIIKAAMKGNGSGTSRKETRGRQDCNERPDEIPGKCEAHDLRGRQGHLGGRGTNIEIQTKLPKKEYIVANRREKEGTSKDFLVRR